MLKTRVITAVVLLAILLPGLFLLPQSFWAGGLALVVGIAAWEWGRFMQLTQRSRQAFGLTLTLVCLFWLGLAPETLGVGQGVATPHTVLWVHVLAVLFWTLVVPVWMRTKWPLPGNFPGFLIGSIVLIPCWLAMVQLRLLGAWPFLAVLALIWIADIGAYFFGRLFGRHKLAVNISPGKTWEGAIGGGLAVLVYGLLMRHFFQHEATPLWLCLLGLLAVTAVSIVGDLFESLLKRRVGLKDSSNVLPGHGGVLDRIDSLTSTLPLVALMWLFFSNSPK